MSNTSELFLSSFPASISRTDIEGFSASLAATVMPVSPAPTYDHPQISVVLPNSKITEIDAHDDVVECFAIRLRGISGYSAQALTNQKDGGHKYGKKRHGVHYLLTVRD